MVDIKDEKLKLKALEDLFEQKRFSDALNLAEQITTDFPNSYHINILHIKILTELNKLGEAVNIAERLMESYPDNINLLIEMATLCFKLNKYDESIEYYNKILFLDPFNTQARESIDKINALKKATEGKEKINMDFISYQSEKMIINEDTVPEFQEDQLSDVDNSDVKLEEPPPVPEIEEAPEIEEIEEIKVEIPEMEEVEVPEIRDVPEVEEIPEKGEIPGFEKEPEVKIEMPELEEEPKGKGVEDQITEPVFDEIAAEETPEVEEKPEVEVEIPEIEDISAEVESNQVVEPEIDDDTVESIERATARLSLTDTEEEIGVSEVEEKGKEGVEIVTESAAELYLSQGLYNEALDIYEKLYDARKEERFFLKIKQLKAHKVGQGEIERLSKLLEIIRKKGE